MHRGEVWWADVPGAANLDNTFTLAVSRFRERITALSSARLDEVCAAYRFAAGC